MNRGHAGLLNLLCGFLSGLAGYHTTFRVRVRCIRHGHALMCGSNQDHYCMRCGRWFDSRPT